MDSIVHPPLAWPNVISDLGGMLEGTILPVLCQQREGTWWSRCSTYLTNDDTAETDNHPATDDFTLEYKVPRVVK